MNGVHDMGGMHGMGPVEIERDEPVFHSEWEARVFALNLASGFHRKWNMDMGRHSRERMPPAEYLAATYYERWLYGLEKLLVEEGLVSARELETGRAGEKAGGVRPLAVAEVATYLRFRLRARLDDDVPPRFRPGDAVVARNIHPTGHTRLPRYARGRRGAVDRDHGVFIFPDASAMSRDKKPQHLYTVRFAARELWGPGAFARDSVHVNLWDDHLDPA
ncbi:MAG: nitrile hydratase subunit beta [Betaproteobacteria bacterium]|nr:nitrile hydratase subunit beta [Betaproteobacteria bacterium]MBI2509866.1 nitrile hydratase subunit beta [Betaproteobacteria bacterium]